MEKIEMRYQLILQDDSFYLRCSSAGQYLKLCRLTSKVAHMAQRQFLQAVDTGQGKGMMQFQLIVGIIIIEKQPYLALVTEVSKVAIFLREPIYQIRKVKFIPYRLQADYKQNDHSAEKKVLKGIEDYLLTYCYFSYSEPLTLTQSKIGKAITTPQEKYFWNQEILKTLSPFGCHWCVPIICGYIQQINAETTYFRYSYLLISRKSKYMSGTRFISRGCDEKANSANFIETEAILKCHNLIFAHVSLRGSVPIFWKQSGVKTDIQFGISEEDTENENIILQHYQNLTKEYQSNIVTINLLSKVHSPEKELNNRFEFYLQRAKHLTYLCFDLNQEMRDKKVGQKNIDRFVEENSETFMTPENFYCANQFTRETMCWQNIIVRINCLDCIDRTNVVMTRINDLFLMYAIDFINKNNKVPEKKIYFCPNFESELMDTWVNLGNTISMIYCGTESVATHMVRRENNSFSSMVTSGMKSINRYYNANRMDDFKQECIDSFLKFQPPPQEIDYFRKNALKWIPKHQYCDYLDLKVKVITWNLGSQNPKDLDSRDLSLFCADGIDLLCVALQEVVELNSYNTLVNISQQKTTEWAKLIGKFIGETQYTLLTQYNMVGLASLVFIKKKQLCLVRDRHWTYIKTGFNNNLGNKGCISVVLDMEATSISFSNFHLASGEEKEQERKKSLKYIVSELIRNKDLGKIWKACDYHLLAGDFNFRLKNKQECLESLYVIQKISKGLSFTQVLKDLSAKTLFESMRTADTEFPALELDTELGELNESRILFPPTYKYIKGASDYDQKRCPSWCDRILYAKDPSLPLKVKRYTDFKSHFSDHRPVLLICQVSLKKTRQQDKQSLLSTFMRPFNSQA